jgi:1-acyl-sn-glycerol-3-phosphate acyltransferase
MGAAVPRNLHYMARATLFKPGMTEWFLLNMNAFPVHLGVPDRKAIRQARQLLRNGNMLLIFPEGTRTVDGSLGKAQAGIGLIAHGAKVPVVPVFLSGTQKVLPRKAKMIRLAEITVSFGKPLDMEHYRRSKPGREIYENIGKEAMTRIGELRDRLMG